MSIDFQSNLAALQHEQLANFKYYKPLSHAVEEFVREAQDDRRIYLGVPEIDRRMRGVGAGHILSILGFSHSGKTQMWLHMLRHNRDKRMLLFIPDEPATLVLAKLASIEHSVEARQLEEDIARNDQNAKQLLRDVVDLYPNLIVYDGSLDAIQMEHAYEEACDVWGAEPDMVTFDYLQQLRVAETIPDQMGWVKTFGRKHNVPVCVLHQTSRSSGADGKKLSIDSGSYGGEADATFIVGVRRKKFAIQELIDEQEEKKARAVKPETVESADDRIQELQHQARIHEYTLTVNMPKNKRPGGGLVDDVDLELDVQTGRLHPLGAGDLPRAYREQLPKNNPSTTYNHSGYTDDYEQLEIAS